MAAKGFSTVSSSSFRWKHDVFLSFRGEDTRKNFTDHLYAALVSAGVVTFRDDEELPRGNEISSELLKAIEESKLSLVVFSKNYASSRWCLDELVKIIQCKNKIGQIVIPIFYNVDPSDVRKQTGNFAEAFAEHEERFKAKKEMLKEWRDALLEAGNLSGWDLRSIANGYESKFIQMIVEDVQRKVYHNRTRLNVARHPVAIECRVEWVRALLGIGSEEVRIVGIYGMGGIGKTTIAKAVYNRVCEEFEGSSFLSNIKDESQQPNCLARKQEQLLSDILSWKNIKIDNVDRGISLIQERLCHRRVFLVLDDLDESTQWKALAGDRKWFGPGSRILVTTRDEHLLTELEVDERYKVEELNPEESIQLLSWHAFRKPAPENDYLLLSNSVVQHAQGLPLALEILGSFLFKRSQPEWESFVEKLGKVPHHQIQKKLRISFDTLDDDLLKAIFLDIACFFVGMNKDYVMTILDGCGFFPKISIEVLVERSLLTIDPHDQELRMHDLLPDMGREIVREASAPHPGHRSRLWFHRDVVDVLTKQTGMEAVEGLSLDVPALEDALVSTEALAKMTNLRLLRIDSVRFSGCYEKFSKELRWLHWQRCPVKVLPPNLYLDNLVVLDMKFSSLKKVWKETKSLHKLKILDLSYSIYLGETPNFAGLPSLERLELEGCTGLVDVDQSIGQLERLVSLNLAECKNIRELPDSIGNLRSLVFLDLAECKNMRELPDSIGNLRSLVFLNLAECKNIRVLPDSICNLRSLEIMSLRGCSKLCGLPEHLGKLEALRKFDASGSAITELPASIGLLKNLEGLSLAGLGEDESQSKSWFSFFSSWVSPEPAASSSSLLLPATFLHLRSLRGLNLCERNLSDHEISIDFRSFPFLQSLNLGGNKFCDLPAGISNHPELLYLLLNDCKNLQSIVELPPKLMELEAAQCTSLETYPNLSNVGVDLSKICITNCRKTVDSQGWDFRQIALRGRQKLPVVWNVPDLHHPEKTFNSLPKYLEAFFPAREVPDWFDYKEVGGTISYCLPIKSMMRTMTLPIGERRSMIRSMIRDMTLPIGGRRSMIRSTILWVVCGVNEKYYNNGGTPASVAISFKNKTKGRQRFGMSDFYDLDGEICEDHAWVCLLSDFIFAEIKVWEGDEIEVSAEGRGGICVKKCGIHLGTD